MVLFCRNMQTLFTVFAGVARYARAFILNRFGARTSRASASPIVRASLIARDTHASHATQTLHTWCAILTPATCLALGLGPWLATEVPELVATGTIVASAAGASGGSAAAKP